MKTLSLKLDDSIFTETESITAQLNQARNRYINEALKIYNQYNKRKILKNALQKESKIVAQNSMSVLAEFEMLCDEI